MEWIEVTIITISEAVEAITAFIHELGANVSIQDPKDAASFKTDLNWIIIDEKLLEQKDTIIKAYFTEDDSVETKIELLKSKLKEISGYLDIGKGEVFIKNVSEEDWANGWKKYFKPIKISDKIVIKPTWETYEKTDCEIVVELDPGMAFGTGTHETTRLCVKLLEKYIDKNSVVYDIGCGSGILSICASKLGAASIIGCDLDPVAVSSSKSNIALNDLSNIEVKEGNLLDVFDDKANIIVANIGADAIIYLAGMVGNYLNSEGIFISSGIILSRLEEVKSALQNNNFNIIEVLIEGEWVAVVSKKIDN